MIYFDIRITELQNKYLDRTKEHSKLMNHVSIDFWCISWLKKREKYTPRKILHTHFEWYYYSTQLKRFEMRSCKKLTFYRKKCLVKPYYLCHAHSIHVHLSYKRDMWLEAPKYLMHTILVSVIKSPHLLKNLHQTSIWTFELST